MTFLPLTPSGTSHNNNNIDNGSSESPELQGTGKEGRFTNHIFELSYAWAYLLGRCTSAHPGLRNRSFNSLVNEGYNTLTSFVVANAVGFHISVCTSQPLPSGFLLVCATSHSFDNAYERGFAWFCACRGADGDGARGENGNLSHNCWRFAALDGEWEAFCTREHPKGLMLPRYRWLALYPVSFRLGSVETLGQSSRFARKMNIVRTLNNSAAYSGSASIWEVFGSWGICKRAHFDVFLWVLIWISMKWLRGMNLWNCRMLPV